MVKKLKLLFLSFLSFIVLVAAGIGFVSPNAGLANGREFLVDRVFDNSPSEEPSLGLTGVNSSDLCLQNSDDHPELAWLSCNNSPVFTSFAYTSDSSVIRRYGRYRDAASATFLYQYRLGGRDSNLSGLNSDSKFHPMSDTSFTPDQADKLYQGIAIMARILKGRERELFVCAANRTQSQIPSRYIGSVGSSHSSTSIEVPFGGNIDVPTGSPISPGERYIAGNNPILQDVRELMSERSYIAIGAYEQSLSPGRNASGAFTYSQPLARVQSTNSKLFGLSFNVNDLDLSSPQRVASVLFHELMHNLGFGHTSNDPQAYRNRGVAILALEDCMKEEAEQIRPVCYSGDSGIPRDCGAPNGPIDGNID